MASLVAAERPTPRVSTSFLRPTMSEENVPLNLGVDEEEASPLYEARGRSPEGCSGSEGEEDERASITGDFDCHICFETATDPCVTRCGHLFCWHDLRQWLRLHPTSPRCPVCKTPCSMERDVVPIFGRGKRRRARQPSVTKSDTTEEPQTLPSPPATPPPTSLPAPSPTRTASHGVSEVALLAGVPVPSGSRGPIVEKDRPVVQTPHPLFLEQILRHQFARILSLLALAVFLSLLGLPRS